MRGLLSQASSHLGFTLLPTRVNSGPISPPTRLPAAFCTAWHDAQNDWQYKLAPAAGSGGVTRVRPILSPATGVLLAMRNADISRASSSLNLKFGIVAVAAYACGSF